MRPGLSALLAVSAAAFAAQTPAERINDAATVFNEIMAAPDKGIPRDLIEKAHCIVIVPGLKKGGFIVGAQYGKGVAVCRQSGGTGWTGPSTVRLEGGSIGAQIGGGETDVVMLVMNENGARKLMKSEFTLGAGGAVMAGPVGRDATAQTDAYMRAEILSYSRSRGVFAGVTLQGSTLRADEKDNEELYSERVSHQDILTGKVNAPPAASVLYAALNRSSAAGTEREAERKRPKK